MHNKINNPGTYENNMNPNKTKLDQQCRLAVGCLLLAVVTFVSSASAQLTITGNSQLGAVPLTPTWIPATDSLIANLGPTTAVGNFAEYTAANVTNLTRLGVPVTIFPYASATNLCICGNDAVAGKLLVYTLPASANGYDITNITVYGGWVDAGRDRQDYTVSYSTVAAPTSFNYLTTVRYSPSNPTSIGSATRVAITDLSGAAIAKSVAAVAFNFIAPPSENSAVGYTAITVQGTVATSLVVPVALITTSNETNSASFTPSWVIETDSLIAGQTPTSSAGNFANSGTGGLPALTDGNFGDVGSFGNYASCGGSSGTSLIYTLINSVNGSDLTNIVVYTGWPDNGRFGQYYTVSYSAVTAPTTFIPLTTVFYLPPIPASTRVAARVAISPLSGVPFAKNVASVKFDFASPTLASSFNNGWQGYAEIVLEGTDSAPPTAPPSPYLTQDTLPTYAETVVGDQVVFTAAYSNSPPANLQWLVITNGVTNLVAGATNETLTLSNVQTNNTGRYLLKAVNATNNAGVSYSTPEQLVVGSTPALVNGVIVNYASQNFPGSTNFFPAWPVDTNNLNLIYGFAYGSGPGTFTYVGDFTGGGNYCNADPTILSDGVAGSMTSLPNLEFAAGGTFISGAGQTVTYTLVTNSAPFGLDLTNITIFGGWQDAGRDEQKYQVLYSTVQAPTSFAPLLTANYNPTNPNNQPTVSRTTLVPASGVLAHNVAAVQINWNLSPGPENGWEGYSEILVGGQPSTGFVPGLTNDVSPLTASDVVGSQIIMTAGFSGATTLQWKKNGTNLPGATTSVLTLNNLQLTDAGAYTLVASNSVGANSTTACTLTVIPAPTAVSNVLTAIATQTSDDSVFTPTWDASVLASSLIYKVSPSISGDGDFTGGYFGAIPTAGSPPEVLTDGTFGTIDFNLTGTHGWVSCLGTGSRATAISFPPRGGQFVIYTLTNSANGYDITNIMTTGGWNDAGRDQQAYTVYYATVADPTYFIPLTSVNYNPTNPVGYSMNRATITPASGSLATNVAVLMFDMRLPAGENGFSGYSEIGVYGSPSTTPPTGPVFAVTTANEYLPAATAPDWTIETPNLIAGQLPSSVGSGNFSIEAGVTGVSALTDGTFGPADATATYATCGNAAGTSITYTSATGWDLTNIVVYSGWGNYNRDGQFYNITYSTLSAPATFVPLTGITYDPPWPLGVDGGLTPAANRVQVAPAGGAVTLATNVHQVKFDFTLQNGRDNGYSGYAEIVLQGSDLAAPTLPIIAGPTVVGGNLILTGTGGTPNYGYTLLTATNMLTPVIDWTISVTGVLNGNGAFSNAIPIDVSQPASFFRMRMP
jgi:hypothetical protein